MPRKRTNGRFIRALDPGDDCSPAPSFSGSSPRHVYYRLRWMPNFRKDNQYEFDVTDGAQLSSRAFLPDDDISRCLYDMA